MSGASFAVKEIADLGSGSTPPRANAERYYGGTIPWVKSGELRNSRILDTEEKVTAAALAETSLRMVPSGAVLVAMYGATAGRVGVLGIDATTNQAVCHVIPDAGRVDTRYLFHALNAKLPEFLSRRVGGAQPNISQQTIAEARVRLPALDEQRRIASILDEADEARAKRREALAILEQFPQAVFYEMFGDSAENPKRLPIRLLGELCSSYSGGTPSTSREDLWEGTLPWFTPKDLKHDDLFDSQDHISETVPVQTNLRLLPPETVVIVVRGMILARAFPVTLLRCAGTINQDLKALLPKAPLEPQYLAAALRCQSAAILQRVTDAGHGTKRLDSAVVNAISVIVPPIQQQKLFAERIATIQNLRRDMLASLARLDALYASLQHRAFRGEL